MALTEEQRQENKKSMTKYMSVVFGGVFSYFFGYIGSMMQEEAQSVGAAIGTAISSLEEGDILFPINGLSMLGIGIGLLTIIPIYFFLKIDTEKNNSYKADEVAGTGGFMSKKELQEYKDTYIKPDPPKPEERDWESPNIIMGNTMRRPVNSRMMKGNNNVLIVGSAGTGKSRFYIKPNVLQMNSSYVITDPSGEIVYSLGKVLQDHGYKIKIFNISDMKHSNCYNPLHYIRDEAGVNSVIDCFINNTTNGKDGEDFWVKAEKLLYSACIYYLRDFCTDESKKNFAHILNMVNASAVDENNPNAKSPLDDLFEALPQSSTAWKTYKAFKQAAGKTLKSIVISCVTRLQPFFTAQVVNLTQQDQLELEKMGDEKTALFIITPQADRTYSFLASMLYSQLFETLYHVGEQQKANGGSEQLKVPVRCMMDEFANIGTVPEFPSKLSTMRKYNISATIVLQDIAQIETMYQDDWKTLVGNCSTIIFLGSSEPNTLKYFSEMLGKKTITSKSRNVSGKGGSKGFQQTGREVMTADELGRMDSNYEIVCTFALRPVFDEKYHYEKHPLYNQTADVKEKEEERCFLYRNMATYDNSKPMHINSMLKAKAESARLLKEKDVTDPISATDFSLSGSKSEVYDNFKIERSKRAKAEHYMIEECTELAIRSTDPVCVIKTKSVPVSDLINIARRVALSTGKDRIIMFTELADEKNLIGIGLDFKEEKLSESMTNKYCMMLETGVSEDYPDIKQVVLTKISSNENVFLNYKVEVNSMYAPKEEVSQEKNLNNNTSEGANDTAMDIVKEPEITANLVEEMMDLV